MLALCHETRGVRLKEFLQSSSHEMEGRETEDMVKDHP